ncbi:MAG TPA: peptidylprolyl isomerase [Ornithinicoccus sp.]|jgi:peptidyl-prolyl cis-trans isomerase B (cyclophilin B)|nr:peptidylprolyl isomerase [Ornithinicoccus sp.]
MPHRRRRLLAALAVGAALLAGCGSEVPDDAAESPTGSAAAAPAEDTLATATEQPLPSCDPPPPLPTDVPTYEARQAPTERPADRLEATLRTNCGDLTLELYGDLAPVTVASFQFLAGEGYWENSPCHRLTTAGIFVLQCGDPTGTGRGTPGYTFGIENAPADGRYPRGTVAMARSRDPNSNGGQFFIVHQDTQLPVNDGGYSVFGKVTSGMEIIDQIAELGVDGGAADGVPAQMISILQVEVTEQKASES